MKNFDHSNLPYTDSKPQGAADFYFAINATFRFILNRKGLSDLRRYWSELGAAYYNPVTRKWQAEGLAGIAAYWSSFFAAEPGADVEVAQEAEQVVLNVTRCPAIHHLRSEGRDIVSCYCQHCYFVNEAMAEPAGYTVRIEGGNGSCQQRFFSRSQGQPPQDLSRIRAAT